MEKVQTSDYRKKNRILYFKYNKAGSYEQTKFYLNIIIIIFCISKKIITTEKLQKISK